MIYDPCTVQHTGWLVDLCGIKFLVSMKPVISDHTAVGGQSDSNVLIIMQRINSYLYLLPPWIEFCPLNAFVSAGGSSLLYAAGLSIRHSPAVEIRNRKFQ